MENTIEELKSDEVEFSLQTSFKKNPVPHLLCLLFAFIVGGIIMSLYDEQRHKEGAIFEVYTLSNGVIKLPIKEMYLPALTNKEIQIIGISLNKIKK